MTKGTLIMSTNAKLALGVIKENTSQKKQEDIIQRIMKDYQKKYSIKNEIFSLGKREIHVCYLPSYDLFEQTKKAESQAREISGSSLYSIESDHCIFLTDTRDKKFEELYFRHKQKADQLATKLWTLNDVKYPNQWTHETAMILGGAFELSFGETLYKFRMNLR